MKSGIVLLIGRPNVGKSTFLNNIIGQKVAITSPKPQTTRFPIRALYQDEKGEIIFIDTPGLMRKTEDQLSQNINKKTLRELNEEIDVVLYMVDHTRKRDFEEARVLGIVRKINKPKILVVNKIDITDRTYKPQYEFLKEEIPLWYEISALKKLHLKPLLDKIFELLPEQSVKTNQQPTINSPYPLLNLDSKTFIAELIREKIFLKMRKEIPYKTMVVVDEIIERNKKLTYIKARILVSDTRYKKMLIGKGGKAIKEIGIMARKELEVATNKKIYLELLVETDKHWMEIYQ